MLFGTMRTTRLCVIGAICAGVTVSMNWEHEYRTVRQNDLNEGQVTADIDRFKATYGNSDFGDQDLRDQIAAFDEWSKYHKGGEWKKDSLNEKAYFDAVMKHIGLLTTKCEKVKRELHNEKMELREQIEATYSAIQKLKSFQEDENIRRAIEAEMVGWRDHDVAVLKQLNMVLDAGLKHCEKVDADARQAAAAAKPAPKPQSTETMNVEQDLISHLNAGDLDAACEYMVLKGINYEEACAIAKGKVSKWMRKQFTLNAKYKAYKAKFDDDRRRAQRKVNKMTSADRKKQKDQLGDILSRHGQLWSSGK